jgi:hypothetical protein
MNDGAEQLHGLGHAFGQGADRPLRPILMARILKELERAAPASLSGKPRNAPEAHASAAGTG